MSRVNLVYANLFHKFILFPAILVDPVWTSFIKISNDSQALRNKEKVGMRSELDTKVVSYETSTVYMTVLSTLERTKRNRSPSFKDYT